MKLKSHPLTLTLGCGITINLGILLCIYISEPLIWFASWRCLTEYVWQLFLKKSYKKHQHFLMQKFLFWKEVVPHSQCTMMWEPQDAHQRLKSAVNQNTGSCFVPYSSSRFWSMNKSQKGQIGKRNLPAFLCSEHFTA